MSNPSRFIDTRSYFKSNYDKALELVIPKVYYEQDYALSGRDIDIIDQVINSHLNILGSISSIINVSAVAGTQYSAINTSAGFSPFLIKQTNLTDIDTNDFERKILLPLDKSFRDFDSSSEFSDYLTDTLLPSIRLNKPTADFVGGAASANHNYLITNLSWLYFLNLSGASSLSYQPSAYVHDVIIEKLYNRSPVLINDGIRGLTEYIFKNYTTCSTWGRGVLPADFRPPQYTVSNSYTSGTQQLDRLNVLVDVLYSPLYIDQQDIRVKTAIDDYLTNGYTIESEVVDGPFSRLIKGLSYGVADYLNSVDLINVLYDIEQCPDDLLPHVANLIGWKLFGSEPDRWRLQIANAISVYKSAGTKKSIQFAVDSVFAQDVFDVSSKIYELWESYVPNLIYYAIATESTFFKDFTTWNRTLARDLGVDSFSPSSMDENARIATDTIIYDLAREFSGNFILGGKPFPLGSPNFVFNYRGRDFPVPPFEEYPYYVATILNADMIDAIADKLVCFGVPQDFALEVTDYINQNTLLAHDDLRTDNNWLIFTSGATYPPNWDTIIQDISNKKIDYIPLWNGKSSHFKVIFEASEFDFVKTSLEVDSREALKIASQVANDFSPAHSIPDVMVTLSSIDRNYTSSIILPYILFDKLDTPHVNYTSAAGLSRFGASSLVMGTYKRGIASSLSVFSRGDVDSLADSLRNPDGTIAYLPRRNHRRRDLKYLLPKDGFYTRTGFNQPVTWDMSATENSYTSSLGFLPLGLIPSSQQFVPISDYINLPAIWSRCETISSPNYYSGLYVSNTFPCRGWRGIESNSKILSKGSRPDYFVDRGQLDPFVATLHYIEEQSKIYDASTYYYYNLSALRAESLWKNVLQSYANSSTELSGGFPNSFDEYYKVALGRQFHKLYEDYCHNFNRHRLIPYVLNLDGPTIFGHTFGSVLKNSNLNDNGSLTLAYPNLIASSLTNVTNFRNGSTIFSASASTSGTYIANNVTDCYIGTYEFRNSGVLKYIELSQTSGTSTDNSFAVIRLDKNNKNPNRLNDLIYNNTLIKQKSVNGLGRIRFDVTKYSIDDPGYDVTTNFLTPEHNFKLNLKTLIAHTDGRVFGGGTIGVWIHTMPENSKVWTFNSDDTWIQHDVSAVSNQSLIDDYAHLINLPQYEKQIDNASNGKRFQCLKVLDPKNSNRENDLLNTLKDSDFTDIELTFNTKNQPISVPNSYFTNNTQVHRLNQKYVIEIFTLPNSNDRFTLYYGINLIDSTLNRWSKPLVGGIPNGANMGDIYDNSIYCPEFRVDLTREQVLSIIKYFNNLTGTYSRFGYGSRVAATTSSVYETSGGSRINYVQDPTWAPSQRDTTLNSFLLQSVILKN
tara:strand:- start:1922 stop:5989 length:4068 start_codon:yes stop_codon:yes gene_type:complete